ncbi:MAG: hypothetical protein ACHQHM_07050, partial [Thermoanaerobaculales bacterium]
SKAAADEAEAKVETEAEKVADEAKAAAKQAAAETKAAAVAAKVAASGAVHDASPAEGNVSQWAKWLADRLRSVPDIQVYGALRLNDLVSRGPASARAVWATANKVLGKDYGNITIADLLKRFAP